MESNAMKSTPTASRILIIATRTLIAFITQQPGKTIAFVKEDLKGTEELVLSIENARRKLIADIDRCADTEHANVKMDTRKMIMICKQNNLLSLVR